MLYLKEINSTLIYLSKQNIRNKLGVDLHAKLTSLFLMDVLVLINDFLQETIFLTKKDSLGTVILAVTKQDVQAILFCFTISKKTSTTI